MQTQQSNFEKINKPNINPVKLRENLLDVQKMGMENSSTGIYQRKLIYNRGFINWGKI